MKLLPQIVYAATSLVHLKLWLHREKEEDIPPFLDLDLSHFREIPIRLELENGWVGVQKQHVGRGFFIEWFKKEVQS